MKKDRGPRLSRRAFVALGVTAAALPLQASATGALPAGAPQIWFIRHAESEINLPANPRAVPDGGISYPLTRRGVEQARALARALAAVHVSAIYTSTHLRAIQTADAVAFQHGLTLSLAPEAAELDLGVAGASEDVHAVYMELTRRWLEGDLDARHGAGESFADLQRRFLPFVREVMNRHAHDRGVIVIVTHGATIGLMVPILASNVPAEFALGHPLPNTGIVKTELRDSRLLCTEWAGIGSTDLGG